MRLHEPRIMPVADAELSAEHVDALHPFFAPGDDIPNVVRTLVRAPDARKAFAPWGRYVLSAANSLEPRQREIVILRIGYLCRSGYEFAQHRRIGLAAGLSPEEIDALKRPGLAGWSMPDAALVQACDDIVENHFVSTSSWTRLRTSFSERQVIDVVLTAGQYVQVCIMLNSFGVQLEAGIDHEPEFRPPAAD